MDEQALFAGSARACCGGGVGRAQPSCGGEAVSRQRLVGDPLDAGFEATGSAAAKPMGGKRRNVLGEQRVWLRQRLAEKPDLTLKALRAELAERGCKVSLWAGHSTMRDVCSHTGAQAAVRLTPIALFPCWEKPR